MCSVFLWGLYKSYFNIITTCLFLCLSKRLSNLYNCINGRIILKLFAHTIITTTIEIDNNLNILSNNEFFCLPGRKYIISFEEFHEIRINYVRIHLYVKETLYLVIILKIQLIKSFLDELQVFIDKVTNYWSEWNLITEIKRNMKKYSSLRMKNVYLVVLIR
jgi:hypothetical protein